MIAQQTNNLAFIQQLDTEGISLQDYLAMMIEKELLKQGMIHSERAEDVLKELEA